MEVPLWRNVRRKTKDLTALHHYTNVKNAVRWGVTGKIVVIKRLITAGVYVVAPMIKIKSDKNSW